MNMVHNMVDDKVKSEYINTANRIQSTWKGNNTYPEYNVPT